MPWKKALHLPVGGFGGARNRGRPGRWCAHRQREKGLVQALIEVPRHIAEALALEPQIEQLARDLAKSRDVLFLGRGTGFPIAMLRAMRRGISRAIWLSQ
jgi:hypothetical protein